MLLSIEETTESNAYTVHFDSTKNLLDYGIEEQAEIVAEFYSTDNPKYQDYIQSIQSTTN
ncbi:hypothetical protein KKC94_02880 [Patescibacteria group bacterium]|nr:hypothetical protein [Patescibacteria group bacterium]